MLRISINLSLIVLFLFGAVTAFTQPANDSCQFSQEITTLRNFCFNGNMDGASFDLRKPSCSNDSFSVWYDFEARGEGLLFDFIASQPSTVHIYEVTGDFCDRFTMFTAECRETRIHNDDFLTIGETYLIQISAPGDSIGTFRACFDNFKKSESARNDIACFAKPVGANGRYHSGTTLIATPDWNNPNCQAFSRQSLWYRFSPSPGSVEADLIIDATEFDSTYSVMMMRFNNNNCNGLPIFHSNAQFCKLGGQVDTFRVEDLDNNTDYYIAVGSHALDKNPFRFAISEIPDPNGCAVNNLCHQAIDITAPSSDIDTTCFHGCTAGAEPYGPGEPGTCFNLLNPTVWHTFVANDMAYGARIILLSEDLEAAQMAIFKGDTCDVITELACDIDFNGAVDLSIFDLVPGDRYYVAVSDIFGNEGQYDICIRQFADEASCRFFSDLRAVNTSYGSPLEGPYQSGESVEICYTVSAWNKSLCNLFQGIMPSFGNGWDQSSFNTAGRPVNITKQLEPHTVGHWGWYPAGQITYNVDNPDKGFYTSDQLEGGWYFANHQFGLDPNFTTGDASDCSNNSGDTWEVCFTLKVKEFDDCQNTPNINANVTMWTFADSEIGMNTDVSCLLDQADVLNSTVRCCEGPSTADFQDDICHGSIFTRNLNPMNDPDLTHTWEVIAPVGVYGAEAGAGNEISDQLFNFTGSLQTVQYIISAKNGDCFGPKAIYNIVVVPQIVVEAGDNKVVCAGTDVQLGGNPTATGGSGNFTYAWSGGLDMVSNPTANVSVETRFLLTIIDSRGCRDIDTVRVFTTPQPEPTIIAPTKACAGEMISIRVSIENGTPPFSYNILRDNQVVATIMTNDAIRDENIIFNEEGTYTVGDLTDANCDGVPSNAIFIREEEPAVNNLSVTLCFGESTTINGDIYNQSGTFVITIENGASSGCDSIVNAFITVLSEIDVSGETIIPDNGTENGAIILNNINGGLAPYTVSWSNGDSGRTITNLKTGNYTATIKDANNCMQSLTFFVPKMVATNQVELNSYFELRPNIIREGDEILLQASVPFDLNRIEILDVSGKLYTSNKIKEANATSWTLPAPSHGGSYFISVQTAEGKQATLPFVVVK